MNYIFVFSFDITYGIEECYIHIAPANTIMEAWEQIKSIDPDISLESLDMVNIKSFTIGEKDIQATRFYCTGDNLNPFKILSTYLNEPLEP